MVKYNDNAKHVHRPVPCPHYDVAAMEVWLEAMAGEGLLLARDGFFLGFADFELSKPCAMKYRLQAAKTPKSAFDENHPDEEEQELSEAMGWEYVARRGEFHIYRCSDPDAPELNTDPQVQALTLKAVSKRLPNHLVSLIIWLVIYPIFFFDEGIVRAAIAVGSAVSIYSLIMLVWCIAGELRAIVHIRRIRKRLERGESSPPASHSSAAALRYLCRRWLFVLAVILWVVLIILAFVRVGNIEKPLDEFEGEPPFATLSDFWPEGEDYEAVNFLSSSNIYEQLSDPLIAPNSIIWREAAYVLLPDHSESGGHLTVYYHEMSSELLAKIVAWEMLREAKHSKYYDEQPAPELGVDYAAVYYDHFPTVLLRDGNIVLQASFVDYSDDELSIDEIARILAESINQ